MPDCSDRLACGKSVGVQRSFTIKFVVIGGTGLIGSKVTMTLRAGGHEVIAAAPDTGVDTITGQGLSAALRGADVVIDLANSRSFDSDIVLAFFRTHEANLLAE